MCTFNHPILLRPFNLEFFSVLFSGDCLETIEFPLGESTSDLV